MLRSASCRRMKSGQDVETRFDAVRGDTAPGEHVSGAPVPSPTRSSIEISMFVPRIANELPEKSAHARRPLTILRIPRDRARWRLGRRALSSTLCAVATILVHGIFLALCLDGVIGRSGGAGLVASREDSGRLEVQIIEEPHIATYASLPQQGVEPVLTPISLSLPLDAGPSSGRTENSGGAAAELHSAHQQAGTAAVGSYLEQINDVVDRAWLRPQIAIGAPEFVCHVRIDQTPRGQIENVTLEECDDNVRWRLSLLTAIRSASPLPTPADPAQFQSTLHTVFKARGGPRPGS